MIVILGGGLSGSLLAYRLSQIHPQPDFLLIDACKQLGGEHTWSFHESDIPSHCRAWVKELIVSSWEQQDVRFQSFNRTLLQPYHSVNSTHFAHVIQNKIKKQLLLEESVLNVEPPYIYLKNRKIEAQVIIDARGLEQRQLENCGFQKFLGMDLELTEPHGLKNPVIMDANCSQEDGYRFFYLLPWSSKKILIEDTRYCSDPYLDTDRLKAEIREYCRRIGWRIERETRTEKGALPIPLFAFQPQKKNRSNNIVPIGMRGGYFHWTTGYSFSYAVRVAEVITQTFLKNPKASSTDLHAALKTIKTEIQKQSRYFSVLNRMLFLGAKPSQRRGIFQRFYHLNESLISRFYRGKLKLRDQARILIGRPPISIHSAIKSIFNSKKPGGNYEHDFTHT